MSVAAAARAPRLEGVAIVLGVNAALVATLVVAGPVTVLGVVALGGAAAAISSRPQRGVLLLVALAPFDGLLLLVPHPAIVDGWKEALTVATLMATFVAPASARASRSRRVPRWAAPLAALLVLSVVSATLVGGLAAALGLKIGFFYLLAAAAIWRCPLDERERDRFVTILLAGGIITAAYGVLQQLIGAQGLVDLGYEYNTTVRFAGSFLRSFSTFVQPFGFGFYLMAVVLIALPSALGDPSRLRSRVLFWSLPLLGAGILTTVVRGAWLGLLVGVVFLGAARHRSLLLLLPLAVVAVLLLPSEAASSALSSTSTGERTAGWSENLDAVLQRPFGAGIGTTGASAEKAAELSGAPTDTYQPDNQYFLALYELGPLGLWLLVLVMRSAYGACRRAARTATGRDSDLALGASALVLGAAAASSVSSFLQIFPMDVLWWVVLAMVATVSGGDAPTGTVTELGVARARPARHGLAGVTRAVAGP